MVRSTGEQIGDFGFVGIAHHPFDAGQRGQLIGRALGIAAGDENARLRIFAMDAAHGLAHVFVGERSDGAGVQNDEVGGAAIGSGFEAAGDELGFEGRAIGLVGATTEVLDEEAGHG